MSTSLYVYLLRSEVISSLGASTNNLGTYAAKGYVFISRSDGGYHTNKILGGVTAFYGFVISPGGGYSPRIPRLWLAVPAKFLLDCKIQ